VLKHGVGVRDAWAQEGITQKEIDRAFLDAAVADQFTNQAASAAILMFRPRALDHEIAPPEVLRRCLGVQTHQGILQRRYFLLNALVRWFQTTYPQLGSEVIHRANAILLLLREDGLKGCRPLISETNAEAY
jgi:hypothetical protein